MSIFNVQIFTFIEALTKSNQYYCFMLNNHSVDTFMSKHFSMCLSMFLLMPQETSKWKNAFGCSDTVVSSTDPVSAEKHEFAEKGA